MRAMLLAAACSTLHTEFDSTFLYKQIMCVIIDSTFENMRATLDSIFIYYARVVSFATACIA